MVLWHALWLDAHYSGGTTAKGKKSSPLKDELEIIKKHPIKNHIILIDDVNCMGKNVGIIKSEAIDLLKEINPIGIISFMDAYIKNPKRKELTVIKNNIMVSCPEIYKNIIK